MRIVILDDYQDVALSCADWGRLGADIEVFNEHVGDPDELVRRLSGVDVVVAMRERTAFPAEVLGRLPDLKLLVTTGMRNPVIDLDAARRHGVVVCGTGGVASSTAELAWALILAAARHVPAEDRAVRDGRWQHTVGTGLAGKTLGLLGLGRLGGRVARIGQAFGMEVVAWSQNLTADRAAELDVKAVAKDELLRSADVVSVHLILSDRTRGLIGAAELALMKPTAILVNTSRGPIVEEAALVDALERGVIAGAAVDVYDVEPLPAGHPLTRAPNTVLSPHLGYVTREGYEVFYREAVEDIEAFTAGYPVRVLNS
jgi:phosphoglycerate dehydrogenase-like enzyme